MLYKESIMFITFSKTNGINSGNMAVIKAYICQCDICDHKWLPREGKLPEERPVCCAKCKNPRWNSKAKK